MKQHPNPHRSSDEAPDWFINSLKVLLMLVFFWQFSKQIPEGYLAMTFGIKPAVVRSLEPIEYQQLLGTTTRLIPHYLHWGDQLIPHQEIDLKNTTTTYFEIPSWKIKQLVEKDWTLSYKGQDLQITKINAIFLKEGLLPVICEEAIDSAICFNTNIKTLEKDFELWLALETKEKKQFFSKIKVGNSRELSSPIIAEASAFWEKLLKKEKFKDIDNLTVAKPVFRNNAYLFKWGNWERYVDRNSGESSIKVDTATFKKWLKYPPQLYDHNKVYKPFYFYIGFRDRRRWDKSCNFIRKLENAAIIDSYPCLERIMEEAKEGDAFSIYLYPDEDFISLLSKERLSDIPPFILNGRSVNLYLSIELVAKPLNPSHQPLDLVTSEFFFQLSTLPGQKARVKMDTLNPRNQSLLEHYHKSASAEVIHIPNFKTVRRLLTANDEYLADIKIDQSYTLVDKVYAVHTFPEFYDFDIFPPLIKSRGLSAVLDKTCYPLSSYPIHYLNTFEMWVGKEKVKLLQVNMILIPKEGEVVCYITDNPNRFNISQRINLLPAESSIYFDQILFERANGEQLAFPLAVAIHLK